MAEQADNEAPKQDAPAEAPKADKPADAPKPEAKADEKPKAKAKADEKPKADAPAKADADKAPAAKGEGEAKAEAKPAATAVAEAPREEPSRPAPTPPADKHYFWGTGRRKTSVARVRIRPGDGKFIVNKREATAYFNHERDREAILQPLQVARMMKSWDIHANVDGGGYTGQAGAIVLGLARALSEAVPEVEHALRDHGLLTRDARMAERKKPGQPGARRRFQFSKR